MFCVYKLAGLWSGIQLFCCNFLQICACDYVCYMPVVCAHILSVLCVCSLLLCSYEPVCTDYLYSLRLAPVHGSPATMLIVYLTRVQRYLVIVYIPQCIQITLFSVQYFVYVFCFGEYLPVQVRSGKRHSPYSRLHYSGCSDLIHYTVIHLAYRLFRHIR